MDDAIEIYDGDWVHDKRIGYFCGQLLPPSLLSSTNAVFIRFKSDGIHSTNMGFQLWYHPYQNGRAH